jgi:hypothetical protein
MITTVDFGIALLLLAILAYRFGRSQPDAGVVPPEPPSWVLYFFLIAFLLVCYATWAGQKWGRNLFVVCLVALSLVLVFGTFADFSNGEFARNASFRAAVWTEAIYTALFILWCSLHGFLLFGKRERAFYNSGSARQAD